MLPEQLLKNCLFRPSFGVKSKCFFTDNCKNNQSSACVPKPEPPNSDQKDAEARGCRLQPTDMLFEDNPHWIQKRDDCEDPTNGGCYYHHKMYHKYTWFDVVYFLRSVRQKQPSNKTPMFKPKPPPPRPPPPAAPAKK